MLLESVNTVRRVCFASVAAIVVAASVAAQSPSLGSPVFLAGDRAVTASAGDQSEPVIAQGAGTLLAVWTDERTDLGGAVAPSSAYAAGSEQDVFGVRLDATGRPLDATSFPIAIGASLQEKPVAAWNGTAWLVAWVSREPTQFFYAAGIRAVRVSAQGQVLDAVPIPVLTYQNSSDADVAITSDGTNWIVAARGTSAGESDVVATRVSPQGQVLDPGGTTIHASPSQLVFDLQLSFAQNVVLAAWVQSGVVNARRLGGDLTPLGVAFQPGGAASAFSVASNGAEFLIAWQQRSTQPFSGSVRATRLTPGGSVLDPGGFLVTSAIDAVNARAKATWDGTRWFVSWGRSIGLGQIGMTAARISAAGIVLDTAGIAVSPAAASVSTQASTIGGLPGGGAVVAWIDRRSGGPFPQDVQAAVVDAAGQVGADFPVSIAAPAQWPADIASDGTGFLVVFRSESSGVERILAQPLDGAGIASGPPIEVGRGITSGPCVAWNGSCYLVAWSDGTGRAVRVAADGTPIDAQPTAVMPGTVTDVAALGDVFLVVGTHAPTTLHLRYAYGTRVRGADGAVVGSPLQLGGSFARVPAVAALGGRWLVAWQQHFSHDNPNTNLRAVFVDGAGQATQSFPMGGGVSPYQVAIASNGSLALVVWHDERNGRANRDIFATRVRPDGSQPDPGGRPIATAPGDQVAPAVAWDGSVFHVAWQDQRAATFFVDRRFEIFGARVDTSNTVLDPNHYAITAGLGANLTPSVAAAGGEAIYTYTTLAPLAPLGSLRVATRATGRVPSPWRDLGLALGAARLTGSGTMQPSTSIALSVTGAVPLAPGALAIGLARFDALLLGGTLVPIPQFVLPLTTDAAGRFTLKLPWAGVATGTRFYIQAWVADPSAPQAWGATNALEAIVP